MLKIHVRLKVIHWEVQLQRPMRGDWNRQRKWKMNKGYWGCFITTPKCPLHLTDWSALSDSTVPWLCHASTILSLLCAWVRYRWSEVPSSTSSGEGEVSAWRCRAGSNNTFYSDGVWIPALLSGTQPVSPLATKVQWFMFNHVISAFTVHIINHLYRSIRKTSHPPKLAYFSLNWLSYVPGLSQTHY